MLVVTCERIAGQEVVETIGPQLQADERAWLEAACAPL